MLLRLGVPGTFETPVVRTADLDIFQAARGTDALVMANDADLAALVHQLGAGADSVLVTCGNASSPPAAGPRWPTVVLMLE